MSLTTDFLKHLLPFAACAAFATPVFEPTGVKLQNNSLTLEKRGTMLFSESFNGNLSKWAITNYENKLVIDTRLYEGEPVAYITYLAKNGTDTAWELTSPSFKVQPGSNFTVNLRYRSTVNMKRAHGHKGMYNNAVLFYNAKGERLPEFTSLNFIDSPDSWNTITFNGSIPAEAATATICIGCDSPNHNLNDIVAISTVDFIQMSPDALPEPQGSVVSVPFQPGNAPKLTINATTPGNTAVKIQYSTAPDVNGAPGTWSPYADALPQKADWLRYKLILTADGDKTPAVSSVTIGSNTHSNWSFNDIVPPVLDVLTTSPNQNPSSALQFRLTDESGINWSKVRLLVDDVDVTAKVTRQGDVLTYQTEQPFKPLPIPFSPWRWALSNFMNRLDFQHLPDSPTALRVFFKGSEGDTCFRIRSQRIPVFPNTDYTLTYSIRHNANLKGATDKISSIVWYDAQDHVIGEPQRITYGTAVKEWQHISIPAKSPANAETALITFGYDNPNFQKNQYFDLDAIDFKGPKPVDSAAALNVHTYTVIAEDLAGTKLNEERAIFFGASLTSNLATMRDDGFVLVDGKPFFPIGLYAVCKREFNQMSFDNAFAGLKANGFNFAHTYNAGRGKDFTEFLDAADKYGFKLWIVPDSDFMGSILRERTRPCILAWYLGDDTSMHIPPAIVRRNHLICHALDNAHLTTQADGTGQMHSSNYEPYIHCTDTFLPEIYPVHGAKPNDTEVPTVIRDMKTIYDDLARNGKPVKSIWAIIQHFDGWGWERFPSFDELRAMSFLSIIHGAHGITWYTYGGFNKNHGVTSTPEHWNEICTVAKQLASIQDALCSRNAASQPAAAILEGPAKDGLGYPSVSCLLKDSAGKKLLLTANSSSKRVKATIPLKGFKAAKVLFEDRSVAIQGAITDEFAPFAVHVYELEP